MPKLVFTPSGPAIIDVEKKAPTMQTASYEEVKDSQLWPEPIESFPPNTICIKVKDHDHERHLFINRKLYEAYILLKAAHPELEKVRLFNLDGDFEKDNPDVGAEFDTATFVVRIPKYRTPTLVNELSPRRKQLYLTELGLTEAQLTPEIIELLFFTHELGHAMQHSNERWEDIDAANSRSLAAIVQTIRTRVGPTTEIEQRIVDLADQQTGEISSSLARGTALQVLSRTDHHGDLAEERYADSFSIRATKKILGI
jgi:hypothetical protein